MQRSVCDEEPPAGCRGAGEADLVEVASEAFCCELRLVREPIAPELPFPRGGSREELLPFLFALVREQPVEVFGAVFYDGWRRPVGYTMPYRGTTSNVGPERRHLLIKAWACRAGSMVVFHNHPSGRTEPSDADMGWTRDLLALAGPLGVEVWDHLILGREPKYCSMADLGLLGRRPGRSRGSGPAVASWARTEREMVASDAERGVRRRQRAKVKYRDPETGRTWSGRGTVAKWLQVYVDQGHLIEEFRVGGRAVRRGSAGGGGG
jgi:hypothetical protein